MENSRQESFNQLRAPCVELSSVGLKFRGRQTAASDVLRALTPVYNVLNELANNNALDEKLAEYAFFPLSHIFNETKRIPANSLELAVKCLRILIAEGWRQRLSPQMGKQLIILMTLIVGGTPQKVSEGEDTKSQPMELAIAGFDCLSAILEVLGGPTAEKTIYHEIGTATIVDQTVYILLESITDGKSDELCVSAARALQALYSRITNRLVLASIMPRTVSALTRVLKPSTQTRRSYRLICIGLQILTHLLKVVLNDQITRVMPEKPSQSKGENDELLLDESWLKATATQIKLALANVIQIRRHERPEVQEALLELCLMVIEECQNSLQESIPIVVDTLVVLSDFDADQMPNRAYSTLVHTATVYPVVLDSLKNSLHIWITAFPRTMQNNDETAKQWALKQISSAFQILSQVQSGSDILTTSLASGLCDSVAAAVNQATTALQPLSNEISNNQSLDILHQGSQSVSFPPVILEHRSQQQTLKDLQSMILRLNKSESGNDITRLVINRVHQENGSPVIAPFWLALTFLKSTTELSTAFDDFISSDQLESSSPYSSRASMIEELYYVSLPILNEPLSDESRDWRVSALALEVVALQAQQLQEAFRPELMDALYPVLQLLASNNSNLQKHAMTCLNILTTACNYENTSTMIIENVDYLVNSVALKLNTFDVSPYPPQVLFMMVKLCGVRLIPYLNDLVDSMFGILDMYHGYPKLVEMMFKTLAAIVEEGTRNPSYLAVGDGKDSTVVDHRRGQYKRLQVSALAEDIVNRKVKRAKQSEDYSDIDDNVSHPKQPWKTEPQTSEKVDEDITSLEDPLGPDDSEEPLPPPREPEDQEKPLSKPHSLLLHIIKSIPAHLSSPSPYLRHSLLSILIQVSPILGAHENSFFPVINDLWPSIVSKISFPSSFNNTSSSNSLMTKDPSETENREPKTTVEDFDFKEEIYVATTACKAVEVMCKNAGDFMATRVETEFPRWERMYRRAWEKVRQDAEKALERRAQQHAKSQPIDTDADKAPDMLLSLGLAQSLSLTTAGAPSGARAFTPHHTLWRSLTTLFMTLLTHVRLPLAVGDQICEFLGAWISRFAGPDYYSSYGQETTTQPTASLRTEIESVQDAIQAMETWNPDLTWFIFQKQKAQVLEITKPKTRPTPKIVEVEDDDEPLKIWSLPGSGLKFAALVF